MKKYDCTRTLDFGHERNRLCKSYAECEGCLLSGGHCVDFIFTEEQIRNLQKWSDEHPEPPKLTREERAFLESFRITNGKYIYRDGNGRLWLTKDYEEIAELWGTMFPFITHDVENWWSVNELLCLKTE
jgi:hypothetical protein